MSYSTKKSKNASKSRRQFLTDCAADVVETVKKVTDFTRFATGVTITKSPGDASLTRHQHQHKLKRKRVGLHSNDVRMSPLAQANEIQKGRIDDGGSRRSRNHRQEKRLNHKKPTPVPRPFSSSPSPEASTILALEESDQRGQKQRGGRTSQEKQISSQTVDLCSSDGDGDRSNGFEEISTPRSAVEKRRTRLGGSKSKSAPERKFSEAVKLRMQQQPNTLPPYPTNTSPWESNKPSQDTDENDSENDTTITQNDTSSLIISSQETNDVHNTDDKYTRETLRSGKKRKRNQGRHGMRETVAFLTNVGSTIDIAEERVPKDEPPPARSKLGSSDIKIPELKPKFQNKSRKKKHYEDVKDMESGFDKNNSGDKSTNAASPYIEQMRGVIATIETNEKSCTFDVDHEHDEISVFSDTVPFTAGSRNTSKTPPRGIRMKKVNNRPRVRVRNKKVGKKIVPGQSLKKNNNSPQQNEKQTHWRREEDQDSYHASTSSSSIKEKQDDGATQWNALEGGSYRSTRNSTTRRGNQYGVSTRPLATNTNSSPVRRSRRNKKQKTPETIDILSSESEDDDSVLLQEEDCVMLKFGLKRLVVDEKKIYNSQDHKPTILFNTEKFIIEITYTKSKVRRDALQKIKIDLSDVEELSYWTGEDTGLDADLDSFIFLRGDVSISMERIRKKKQESVKKSQQLVLEFEDDQHLTDFIVAANDGNIECCSMPPDDVEVNAALLIADSKKKYNLRNRVIAHELDPFTTKRRKDEILVVYPFEVEKNKMYAAASGLKELSWSEVSRGDNQNSAELEDVKNIDASTSYTGNDLPETDVTTTQSCQRTHFVEIRVEDYEKLDTGQWLNDSLIDMWMQWISKDSACKRSSNFHFFTSHFYTTLASEGVNGVQSWTAKKKINIFDKKLIFVPINKTLHWSLCVVVNPGAIKVSVDDDGDNDRLSCMLFFDSLNMHRRGKVHRDLIKWLNSEWKRTKNATETPFTKNSWKMFAPEVPRQDNGSDCGVFVCRYAFAMFQLRHLNFSRQDAGLDKLDSKMDIKQSPSKQKERDTSRSQPFLELITNGKEFDFNVDDIQRIRIEFKNLIRNLHPLYQAAKDNRIKTEKEEKKARKRLKEKGTESAPTFAPKSTETCPIIASSKLNKTSSSTANELSDSSKENRIPREREEEKLAPKAHGSSDEEKQEVYGPLTREDTLEMSKSGTLATDDPLVQNTSNDVIFPDEPEPMPSTHSKRPLAEEWDAESENIVHL